MLKRIVKGGQRQGDSVLLFESLRRGIRPSAPSSFNATGRRRDITFNERFLTPASHPRIIEAIWQFNACKNVHEARILNILRAEKAQYYLEHRPRKQKLLDRVRNKNRALARTWGTVDAWSGLVAKNSPLGLLQRVGVKMFGSRGTTTTMTTG
jgi:hypothetical protein